MNQTAAIRPPVIDWLTVVAITAIAISLNVTFHEGVHALSCVILGGELREFSALHVDCIHTNTLNAKIGAGSASIANLILGTVCWFYLRGMRQQGTALQLFLWLFMLMNWLYGAGYWLFSGVANIGDWAAVIQGWEPHWLWRVVMLIAGAFLFVLAIWLALHELGRFIGGKAPEQTSRAVKLGVLAYLTSGLTILLAGLFNPYGILGLPAVAGLIAALGALSPLLWMMWWFQAHTFKKAARPPLVISRSWGLITIASLVVFLYVFVLGRALSF